MAVSQVANEWQKQVKDVPNQTMAHASDIGWLRFNQTTLNVVGALNANEKDQYLKFTVLDSSATDGKVKLSDQSDSGIRVQIIGPGRRVVADSKPDMGDASENYKALSEGTLSLKSGQYFMHVMRDGTTPASAQIRYDVAMRIGETSVDNYTTVVVPSKKGVSNAPVAEKINNPLASALSSYLSTMSNDTASAATTLLDSINAALTAR